MNIWIHVAIMIGIVALSVGLACIFALNSLIKQFDELKKDFIKYQKEQINDKDN